jgi:hypothetical protein
VETVSGAARKGSTDPSVSQHFGLDWSQPRTDVNLKNYTVQHVAWRIGYPIPYLGKGSDPLCLGGGLAWCVLAGSGGGVLVRDQVRAFFLLRLTYIEDWPPGSG